MRLYQFANKPLKHQSAGKASMSSGKSRRSSKTPPQLERNSTGSSQRKNSERKSHKKRHKKLVDKEIEMLMEWNADPRYSLRNVDTRRSVTR